MSKISGNRNLVLIAKYALGDAIVMTPLVRDIHRTYPGRFRTRTITTAYRYVWANNPYVTQMPMNGSFKIRVHYSHSMGRAYTNRIHFIEAYIRYFNSVTGLEVKLTEFKPDLHVSKEEKAQPPFNLDKPYWVLVAGGKRDITTKWWEPKSFQTVIDALADRVTFIQVGRSQDVHPDLTGVVDLRDKTTPRDLIHLVYHADGVLSPITAVMHMAAAFDKPAVVIAGGREPVGWEGYLHHTYLHTIGQFSCCVSRACWRGTTTQAGSHNCLNYLRAGQEGATIDIARCMHSITPEIVIKAVEQYL